MTEILKTWYAVDIIAEPNAGDAIEFALNELDSLGIEIDSLRKKKDEPQMVTGFFAELPGAVEIAEAIEDSLRIHGLDSSVIESFETRVVEETDWLAEWKKHWKPTEIGKFIIAPPWEVVGETDKIVIRIEPNMAFGTGTHDTTKLCLKAIGERYEAGHTVLDVGTGTGILAIAVAKLGAKTLFACDTDEDSIKIARENAVLNDVAWIEFVDGPLEPDAAIYDFVFANLTVDVIVPILELLLAKTGSLLLLSGILAEQQPIITAALQESQISNFEIETSGEWISVLVEKKNDF
ncbi:MAG: 50S ribosomal protein L11 methyltransferase [Pyrinomonadaceae bacterium]